jgi:hypothetical protein
MKNKVLLSKISTEIETIKKQDFFDIGHSNSLARLAEQLGMVGWLHQVYILHHLVEKL